MVFKEETEKLEIEQQEIEKKYFEILKACLRCRTEENTKMIRRAFDLANEAHKGMRRRSGEPYIYHPIEVAIIVAREIGLGTKSVVCALLHDVVEDTEYTLEDIENLFDSKIASIIDGLTKISNVFDKDSSLQAENFRKMLLTLSDDVRVIFIKLADRLHNMRTLDSMPQNKQLKIASETLFLYAPLAHRLGLYSIKTELEDLSLKYEHPSLYNEINQKLKETEKGRLSYINKFSLPIINKLTNSGLKYSITGRPKSVYSIYTKMQAKNVPFEEVFDIFAIRIIFEPDLNIAEKAQCWSIYSYVTDIYQPKPDRLRDWVSTPKANGYEALHLTVMGPEGQWVEVQIRSQRMDEIAERGYAAHWKYKGDNSDEGELDKWIKKIREMLENPSANALEFLDEFKMNLFSKEIYVFTPKGVLKRLPKNSSALDFAYEIHSEVGNKAIGAKINYKLVSLSHTLNSGDQVEIITSDKQKPQRDWLDFVSTAKAKSAIKSSFKNERKDNIEKGKIILDEKLKELNLHPNSNIFKKLLAEYGVTKKEDLYNKMGMESIELPDLVKVLSKKSKNKFIRYWQLRVSKTTSKINVFGKKKHEDNDENKTPSFNKKKPLYLTEDIDNAQYKLAKCCNPIPGDDVMGYVTPSEELIVHKKKCSIAQKLMSSFGDNIITIEWTVHKIMAHLVRIKLQGIDRLGLVHNITEVISSELSVNMRALAFDTHDGIFEGSIDLYIHNADDLNNLIKDLKKIKGVDKVIRLEDRDY